VPPAAEIAVRGRRILVVDDVYTTGLTVSAVAKALKKAGAAEVDVLTFARVLPGEAQGPDGDFRPHEADAI
jgi:predicted amidophosphoribosyltransferase